MKKLITLLLVLTGMVCTAMAATSTTVYYAVPSHLVNYGSYTVKVNVCTKYNNDQDKEWLTQTMTYTNKTYKGFRVYSVTFTDLYDGCKELQFQIWDGSSQKGMVNPISWTWTGVSTYNGKMYVHGAKDSYKWIAPTYDSESDKIHITYHVQKTNDWTPSYAYIYKGDEGYNNGWAGDPMSENAFNNGWYDYVVSYSFDKIIFDNGSSGDGNQTGEITINDAKDEYWTTYVSGTTTTVDRDSKPEGWIDYKRTSLTDGKFGTICLPYNATVTGATVFKIVSKTEDAGHNLTGINLESVDALEAGKAYIFKATGTTLTATYSGSYTEATAGYGMMGNLSSTPVTLDGSEGYYVVGGDNKIHKVVTGGSGVTIGQYKGYIIPGSITKVANSRSANFLSFEDETTGIAGVEMNDDAEQKVVYNLNGQRVANPTKGLYIVNGKKVIMK